MDVVGLYVVLNLGGDGERTAFAAGWWLRPTPVRLGRFVSTLISRVGLIQAGLFAVALVAMAAVGRGAAVLCDGGGHDAVAS